MCCFTDLIYSSDTCVLNFRGQKTTGKVHRPCNFQSRKCLSPCWDCSVVSKNSSINSKYKFGKKIEIVAIPLNSNLLGY